MSPSSGPISSACRRQRRFFGWDASGLTQESALLTAALPNPVRYQLEAPTHRLRFRQSWILLAARRLGDLYLERL